MFYLYLFRQSVSEMLSSADIDCAVNVCMKQSIDIAVKTGLDNARQRVHQTCVEVLRAAQGGSAPQQHPQAGYGHPQHQQQQQPRSSDGKVPDSLQLLPLYAMSMQKNLAVRGGTDVRTDERAFFQALVMNMGIEESKVFIYPRMFSIHDMAIDAGTSCDNVDDDAPTAGPDRVRLPAILNLSHERLTSEGMFLLENGYDLFLWIGRNVSPAIINTLFGVNTLEGADLSELSIQSDSSDYSSRLNTIIEALREERTRHLQLHFIREGDGHAEAFFSRFLVEDRLVYSVLSFYLLSLPLIALFSKLISCFRRANFTGGTFSYVEYHGFVSRQVSGMPG
jgi:protein transport protein SEC24